MHSLDILKEAKEAGSKALEKCVPTPMVIDDGSLFGQEIPDGLCGFAWVRVICRNKESRRFIHDLKIAGEASNDVNAWGYDWKKSLSGPGYIFWVSDGNQSYEKKSAYAEAMAIVLRKHGIVAYNACRLD